MYQLLQLLIYITITFKIPPNQHSITQSDLWISTISSDVPSHNTTNQTSVRGDIISALAGKLPMEVPEEKIQVTISDKDNAADISMNVRERDWVRGLPLVLELDSNWLDFPPQCARASINRTADEPGWNLMPLFSLSDPRILFIARLHPSRKTICHFPDLFLPPAHVFLSG